MSERCYGCMNLKDAGSVCQHCGYPADGQNAPNQLPVGTVLHGQYMVGRALGQGGFGITYLGWDQNLEMPIAIKEYYPNSYVNRDVSYSNTVSCNTNPEQFRKWRSRFLREAQILAKLRDIPEIVGIYNFFEENDTAYIVMEYVEGTTLRAYTQFRGGRLLPSETFEIFEPIMLALSKVHEAGLIHRDISPDNIMLRKNGGIKILDFGTARDADSVNSSSTEVVLKYGFAPIEQYQRNGKLGPWTDIYALCASIYYCLTGSVPPDAVVRLQGEEDVQWENIPGLTSGQIDALNKGMEILVKKRFQSVEELHKALFASSVPAPVPEPKKPNPAEKAYAKAMEQMEKANTEAAFKQAAAMFAKLSGYEDADAKAALCLEKAEALRKDALYRSACRHQQSGKEDELNLAIEQFASIPDWKDAQERIGDCTHRIQQIQLEKEQKEQARLEQQRQREEARRLAAQQKLEQQRIAAERREQARREAEARKAEQLEAKQKEKEARLAAEKKKKEERLAAQQKKAEEAAARKLEKEKALAEKKAVQTAASEDAPKKKPKLGILAAVAVVAIVACIALFLPKQEQPQLAQSAVTETTSPEAEAPAEQSQPPEKTIVYPVQIYTWNSCAMVLRSDGTIATIGDAGGLDVSGWTDVVALHGNNFCVFGLRSDGTVLATGDEYGKYNVSGWTDITAIAADGNHLVGLKSDGTVVTGNNGSGQWDVTGWTDIVEVSTYQYLDSGLAYTSGGTLGLRRDGTVVATGTAKDVNIDFINSWTDVVALYDGCALQSDGTLLHAEYIHGRPQKNIQDIADASCYAAYVKTDGTLEISVTWSSETVSEAKTWTDIVSVCAWEYNSDSRRLVEFVGLRSDGTVVATGEMNDHVKDWTDIAAISISDDLLIGWRKDRTVVITGPAYEESIWSGLTDLCQPFEVSGQPAAETQPEEAEPVEEIDITAIGLTDGKPTGDPITGKYGMYGTDVTVHSYSYQMLDNNHRRYTLEFTAPEGMSITLHGTSDPDHQKSGPKTTGGKQALVFDYSESDVEALNGISCMFVDGQKQCSVNLWLS